MTRSTPNLEIRKTARGTPILQPRTPGSAIRFRKLLPPGQFLLNQTRP